MTTTQRDLQRCRAEQQRAATALASGTGDVRGLTQGLHDDNVMEEALILSDPDAGFERVLTVDELGCGE